MELTQHILCEEWQQRLLREFRFFSTKSFKVLEIALERAFVIRSLYSLHLIHSSIHRFIRIALVLAVCSAYSLSPFFSLSLQRRLCAHSLEVLLGSGLVLYCQLVRCFVLLFVSHEYTFQSA